jgi:hypothetical protein
MQALGLQGRIAVAASQLQIDRCDLDGTGITLSSRRRHLQSAREASSGSTDSEGSSDLLEAGSGSFDPLELAHGGALSITGGQVDVRNATFRRHGSSGNGGAVYVNGGVASFDNCLFELNAAAGDGGALFVSSGVVKLGARTLLRGNSAAGRGDSIFLESGTVAYRLPAPLGRWIDFGAC